MYIQPNTTIQICKNVPIDNTYQNTLHFSSKSEQHSYFEEKVKYIFNNQSYQRVNKNTLRIAVSSDNLFDCNYLMFQNKSFSTKWFYAFITNIEYINNDTTEVTYEIDVIQSYLLDVTIMRSFIERQHSRTDEIGDNIVSENIGFGDIICVEQERTNLFNNYSAILCRTTSEDTSYEYVNNLPSCCEYHKFDLPEAIGGLADALSNIQRQESVLGIILYPTDLYNDEAGIDLHSKTITMPNSISGYQPRNNKLYTFPYNFIGVDEGGNTGTYRYEWFANGNARFNIGGVFSLLPEVFLVPYNYNGSGANNNHLEKMVMSDFPQIPWTYDTFKNWLMTNTIPTVMNVTRSATMLGTGIATGNIGGVVGGTFGIANELNNVAYEMNRPHQLKGKINAMTDIATKKRDFIFKKMQITKQYAKIIDDYFTKYGYACMEVDVPNIDSRPYWNYVKTVGCNIKGNAPASAISKIAQCFDNGITFWHIVNGVDHVGEYQMNNSPSNIIQGEVE